MAAGAAWMVAFKLLERLIGVVSIVVLARLLTPADFGLVAMATAIIAIVELLSAFSFDVALIQDQEATRAKFDTAWTLNVILAALCSALIAAAAFPAAGFYDEPRLVPVLMCLALGVLVHGFENIGVVTFRKDLRLNRDFQLLMARRVASFVVTISLAFATRSYWALVLGILAGNVVAVAMSYVVHPYRPWFDLTARKSLMQFSKWMLVSNFALTGNNRSPDLVIGKILGPGPLGLFALALEIAHLPSTELSAPINRAVYPGYAKVAADQTMLKMHFLEVIGLTALLMVPAAVGIAAIAPALIPVLLGDAWLQTIPLIEILALSGLLIALRTNIQYVFFALGRSELGTVMHMVSLFLLVPLLILGTLTLGASGAAWAVLATSIAVLPLAYFLLSRLLAVRWSDGRRVSGGPSWQRV